jgi:hypothetical protein
VPGWTHSGFNIHRSERVPPGNREDMERLAQYIIRNPFSVEKMQPNSSGDSIIYRSGMNPKIWRNFEVFSPCDFIARITQHIPDKILQLVRYYGWYSNKMRGQRLKRADAETVDAPQGEIIEVSESNPRRIPKCLALDSQGPIRQRLGVKTTAFSFKSRANAPEGRKAISYQRRLP